MTSTPDLVVRAVASSAGVVHRMFVGEEAGYPLRCCLRDSHVGEPLALVSVSPDGPRGAYRETGPVFVHADGCAGPTGHGYPEDFRRRDQVFRAYDHEGAIVDARLVPAGGGQEGIAVDLLRQPDVAFVHSRNVLHGCYMFEIRLGRAGGGAAATQDRP